MKSSSTLSEISESRNAVDRLPPLPDDSVWDNVRSPGLSASSDRIRGIARELPKQLAAYAYKQRKSFVWVVVMGGTGTGKSTIFNTLCGRTLSETGVERPKTYGPIVYAHRDAAVEKGFPFRSIGIRRIDTQERHPRFGHAGVTGEFLVIEHDREEFSHIAFVDTPDLDSLELHNREMAEDLYLLSDVVVFVMSQEKYADEVLFRFLRRIHEEGKHHFILLNKADYTFSRDEIPASFHAQGLDVRKDRFWHLPYAPHNPERIIAENTAFRDFAGEFFSMLSRDNLQRLLREEKRLGARVLSRRLQDLLDLLQKEKQATKQWLDNLEGIFAGAGRSLLDEQHSHFTTESQEYLREEIRKLFSRYDVLGKPRRFIAGIITAPLRLLGLGREEAGNDRRDALMKIRQKIDLSPIQGAVGTFNRSVLEGLSPSDESSPLFKRLRRPEVVLSHEEIKSRVWQEQEKLTSWLDETFQELARGIPKTKEWGIYSTSILWGMLIISLEIAIGGGIHFLEALLDSAIAPFITKGAVELFAYHEIQKVAQELAFRYEKGLISVIGEQRDRYVECLMSLMTPRETIESLQSLLNPLQVAARG